MSSILDDIDDIFNLTPDKKSDDYNDVSSSNSSFEEEIEGMVDFTESNLNSGNSNNIKEIISDSQKEINKSRGSDLLMDIFDTVDNPKKEEDKNEKTEKSKSVGEERSNESSREERSKQEDDTRRIGRDELSTRSKESSEEVQENEEKVSSDTEEKTTTEEDKQEENEKLSLKEEKVEKSSTKINKTSSIYDDWKLDSPCEDMNIISFYAKKAEMLEYMLHGGKMPFDKWESELKNAYIDLSDHTKLYDLDQLYAKMLQVQQKKDRVQQISIECNSQYYPWDRMLDLLRGLLAKASTAKNAQARDGVVFEHLRDFELYFSRLKMFHNSASMVLKNLESAYDCLSRQVTILLSRGEQDVDSRVVSTSSKSINSKSNNQSLSLYPEPEEPKSSYYDGLSSKAKNRKTGEVDDFSDF